MVAPVSTINSGWEVDADFDEKELSIEEMYGYPEYELTAERTFLIDNLGVWPEFVNPLDADTSKVMTTYMMET